MKKFIVIIGMLASACTYKPSLNEQLVEDIEANILNEYHVERTQVEISSVIMTNDHLKTIINQNTAFGPAHVECDTTLSDRFKEDGSVGYFTHCE